MLDDFKYEYSPHTSIFMAQSSSLSAMARTQVRLAHPSFIATHRTHLFHQIAALSIPFPPVSHSGLILSMLRERRIAFLLKSKSERAKPYSHGYSLPTRRWMPPYANTRTFTWIQFDTCTHVCVIVAQHITYFPEAELNYCFKNSKYDFFLK